jgi:hypothetical protein
MTQALSNILQAKKPPTSSITANKMTKISRFFFFI